MANTPLTPIEQKEINFYGDELTAVRANDGRVYASLRHMSQALGIDVQGQRQRINRHTILNRGLMVCKLHTIQGERDHHVLRVDLVPLWLSGIRTSSVNEEVRPKLERFQEEAAAVLWEAFQEGRLTADPTFEALLQQDNDDVQAYKMLQAMVTLARNQIIMRGQLEAQEAQIQANSTELANHANRLETIEATLGDSGRNVTPEQASQISQAVKTVAMVLSKASGSNQYGAVYGELYRRFGITSYKLLPAHRFEEAMQFMTEWHQSLVGDSPF